MPLKDPLVTVVMPVYNRVEYLDGAIESVLAQTSPSWHLLLADDHSAPETWDRQQYYARDDRVTLRRQEHNVGLFANLNAALLTVKTPFTMLLCSDDRLKPVAVERLLSTVERFPTADLVLASFDALDATGRRYPSAHYDHRRAMTKSTRAVESREALELLLRFGSYNGSLTGMLFRTALYDHVGPFRSDWRHAADWEWIYRAAKTGTLVLSTEKLADIRSHDGQLSFFNHRSGHRVHEMASVIRTLLADPLVAGHPRAQAWAAHQMQHFAWGALRAAVAGDRDLAQQMFQEIANTTGILPTLASLIAWMPTRVVSRVRKEYPTPPG